MTAGSRRHGRPLDPLDLRTVVDAIDRKTLRGKRDAALILVGWTAALRAGELAALDRADVKFTKAGIQIAAGGKVVEAERGSNLEVDPVLALRAWLNAAHVTDGAIFRPVAALTERPNRAHITVRTVNAIVAERAVAAGLAGVTGASLRSGFTADAKARGADVDELDRYLRLAGARPLQPRWTSRRAVRQTSAVPHI